MNELTREADLFDDNVVYSVKDYANYLRNICYQKRNKQNPYYNNIVLAGYSNGETHLASVDMYGNYIAKDYVVAGFAKHFGLSLIANYWNPEISAQQCKELLHRCFSVIYERVCQSTDQIQFAVVTKDGCKVS